MIPLELLAPAKNLACGLAAIDHGADAVYIGAPRFGARASAGNSIGDIRQLCTYAHRFRAKVFVTLNTILYDEELEDVNHLLDELADTGVDAILVQDMAILKLMSERARSGRPLPFAIHASTQTDNRTSDKVRWLQQLGFSRAVLARELSAEEIGQIHSEVPDMELEVFVHGALCVSYSGLCYASEHCFHRSANRGECAQFCRMRFSLLDAEGKEIERERYLLSLKDMNQSATLRQLVEAGASSFKIEGRLKDEAYVKNVTAAYSELLNAIIQEQPDRYCRASDGCCKYTFKPDLNRTFNRGYTTYFVNGRKPDIASFETPKAVGEFVGTVKEIRRDSFNVSGVKSFVNGDGLCFLNQDRQFEGLRANRVEGNRIYPFKMPTGLQPGMALYRSNDQEFERILSKPSASRKLPVSLVLRAVADGFELSATCQSRVVSRHFSLNYQQAQKQPHDNIRRQLSKWGDTIYTCTEIDIPADFNYFIPNSILSEMRRQLMVALEASNAPAYCKPHRIVAEAGDGAPRYAYPYLRNIANRLARDFYDAAGLSAYELKGGIGPVMQCRHCLRYSLGYCVKRGGRKSEWHEPLFLRLGDGRRFRLEFDCKNCQMNVYAEDR